MIDHDTLLEVLSLGEKRRAERRNFLKMAGGTAAAAGGLAMLSACGNDDGDVTVAPTPTPTPTPGSSAVQGDIDVLNFALNLEYLEANYYIYAATGSGLNPTFMTGTGTQGTVTGGRQVTFTDASVASYAREIAADESAHVQFLRSQLAGSAVAQPAINIAGDATGAFTAAARAANVVGPTATFDPYASDENWLIGGMLLSDVGVTAYKGSASAITSKVILEAAAGILAVEAYHSGLLRTLIYSKGLPTGATALTQTTLRTNAQQVSDARDSLDGNTTAAGPPARAADDDQGVFGTDAATSNTVPSDSNGIVFGRTPQQVLNVVYLNRAAVTQGGFFPAGINGNIRTSAAS